MVFQAEIVFGDLRGAIEDLEAARNSPVNVRRSFGRFINLSQKLTSAMRRDYSREKISKWEATKFEGWNQVSDFFKSLRNYDEHECPIQIQVHQKNFYVLQNGGQDRLVAEGTWSLGSPFSQQLPESLKLVSGDPVTGQPSEEEIKPESIEYQFLVYAESEGLQKELGAIGTRDVHILSQRCFQILSNYYEYFCNEMGKV